MTTFSERGTGPGPGGPLIRGLWFHSRALHLQWVVPLLLLLAVISWRIALWLAHYLYFDSVNARAPVAIVAPLLAAVLISVTLSGADVDLERSTARLSIRWRTVHGLVAAVIPGALLAITALDQPQIWGSYALVRNTIGLVGIVLIAATVLPATLTWSPALIYVIVVYFAAPRTPDYGASWWAWPMQPGAPDSSWICATILVITGAVAYGRRGPAPTTSTGERQRSLA